MKTDRENSEDNFEPLTFIESQGGIFLVVEVVVVIIIMIITFILYVVIIIHY